VLSIRMALMPASIGRSHQRVQHQAQRVDQEVTLLTLDQRQPEREEHRKRGASSVQDRDGGVLLLSTLFGQFPFVRKLFADSGYAGPVFHDGAATAMRCGELRLAYASDFRFETGRVARNRNTSIATNAATGTPAPKKPPPSNPTRAVT
jgi:hypothetical protein